MADRVRIVYTIFFGREPGSSMRREMDTDRDGLLSAAELSAFSTSLETDVLQATRASLDGDAVKIRWQPLDLGMARTTTGGGAFSADLIGTVCLNRGDAGAEQSLLFFDSLVIPRPGESELRLDPAPGIRITKSRIAEREIGLNGYKWQGGAGPAAKGYQLSFFVDREDSAGLDDSCKPPPSERQWLRVVLIAGGVFVLLLCIWGAIALRRARR